MRAVAVNIAIEVVELFKQAIPFKGPGMTDVLMTFLSVRFS
jgi:hypothetical protein